jgi:hypothetical protein
VIYTFEVLFRPSFEVWRSPQERVLPLSDLSTPSVSRENGGDEEIFDDAGIAFFPTGFRDFLKFVLRANLVVRF